MSLDVRAMIAESVPPSESPDRDPGSADLPVVKPVDRALMRAIDVVGSLLLLVILAPIALASAVAVRLTSQGPVIFRQKRVGMGGEIFEVLKFRTMENGTHDKVLADSNLYELYKANDFKLPAEAAMTTSVGKWLRRTSMDEIPQLVNVLRGEMGLVGVRPIELEQLDERSVYDQALYRSHRPALTGVWQVEGRSEFRDEHRIELDRRTLEGWGLLTNVSLLLRTPFAVLRGAGAH